METRPGEALGNSGCKSSVGGSEWHEQLRQEVHARGYEVKELKECEYFRFGAGPVVKSVRAWVYPIGFCGKNEVLKISEVPGRCPGLISL